MKGGIRVFDETREAGSLTSIYSSTTLTFSSSCGVKFSGNSAISFSTPNLRFASEADRDVGDIGVVRWWRSQWVWLGLLKMRRESERLKLEYTTGTYS